MKHCIPFLSFSFFVQLELARKLAGPFPPSDACSPLATCHRVLSAFYRPSSTMEQLSGVLTATLSPDATTRRNAERELLQAQAHPSFGPLVLELTQNASAPKAVRQSAALSFKNWIKANWAVSQSVTKGTRATQMLIVHTRKCVSPRYDSSKRLRHL